MALSLSDTQLDQVSAKLFLFQDPNPLRLSRPSASGANLDTRMAPLGADARFKDLSFGVVDFTSNLMAPDVWLHNEEVPWQMASTGKIALLLAALQLRTDVRAVKGTGLISSAADFDELFATIWTRSSVTWVKEIATSVRPPRVSTIFDLSSAVIDFTGASYASGSPSFDRAKLARDDLHQKWPKEPDLTFWERMWQAGTQSDNVAACSLGSEIGIAYVSAVQRAYGLFDPPSMRMMLNSAYGSPPSGTPVTRIAGAPLYRNLKNGKGELVVNPADPAGAKIHSNQGGSVAALMAYLIALMQNKLVSSVAADARAVCDVVRACLADEKSDTMTSLIFEGVENSAGSGSVTKAYTKLGIGASEWLLGPVDLIDPTELARRLKTPSRAIDTFVAAQLAAPTKTALGNYSGSGSVPGALQRSLRQDLNAIIRSRASIFETARFAGVTLRGETNRVLARPPASVEPAHVNRLLIEDAYPAIVSRDHDVLRCEFAYIEAGAKKYGVVAMGIIPVKIGATRFDVERRGRELGAEIHQALTA